MRQGKGKILRKCECLAEAGREEGGACVTKACVSWGAASDAGYLKDAQDETFIQL